MDKKYFYLGSFNEKNDKVVFIDRVDICDVRKLALLAITLEPKTELVGAACYVNALEEYFMLNPAVDLKEVYEKMKKDSSGYKFLCLEVVISFCEDCFRKHNYDKKTLEETMDAYKGNITINFLRMIMEKNIFIMENQK